jgi:hypothetical protein
MRHCTNLHIEQASIQDALVQTLGGLLCHTSPAMAVKDGEE